MNKKLSLLIAIAILIGIAQLIYIYSHNTVYKYPTLFSPSTKSSDQPVQLSALPSNANASQISDYVHKYGIAQTLSYLSSHEASYGSCHNEAHIVGHIAFQLYGGKAFALCTTDCQSGCYHGATEEYFKINGIKNGTTALKEKINTFCSSLTNSFVRGQCEHGIGHGLTAELGYDVPQALKECDLLSDGKENCYTGVFMENIIGALLPTPAFQTNTSKSLAISPIPRFLTNDPLYPCDVVDDKYKTSCYFYQTTRMEQLFSNNFTKVAQTCGSLSTLYQYYCFQSMGRDVAAYTGNNPQASITDCKNATPVANEIYCMEGAVQNTFWDQTGKNAAINFCKAVPQSEGKQDCYNIITSRAQLVIPNKTDQITFCKNYEAKYIQSCLNIVDSPDITVTPSLLFK